MKKIIQIAVLVLSTFVLVGCITTGQKIDYNQVAMIKKRVTTESEIRLIFGEPVTSEVNVKRGIKILTYGYKNDDSIKKGAAGVAGAVAGGVVGNQIGGGSGRALASGVGTLVGGFLASNAVTARNERQYLEVKISLRTGRVIDYNYIERKGRSQKIGVSSGVAPL